MNNQERLKQALDLLHEVYDAGENSDLHERIRLFLVLVGRVDEDPPATPQEIFSPMFYLDN